MPRDTDLEYRTLQLENQRRKRAGVQPIEDYATGPLAERPWWEKYGPSATAPMATAPAAAPSLVARFRGGAMAQGPQQPATSEPPAIDQRALLRLRIDEAQKELLRRDYMARPERGVKFQPYGTVERSGALGDIAGLRSELRLADLAGRTPTPARTPEENAASIAEAQRQTLRYTDPAAYLQKYLLPYAGPGGALTGAINVGGTKAEEAAGQIQRGSEATIRQEMAVPQEQKRIAAAQQEYERVRGLREAGEAFGREMGSLGRQYQTALGKRAIEEAALGSPEDAVKRAQAENIIAEARRTGAAAASPYSPENVATGQQAAAGAAATLGTTPEQVVGVGRAAIQQMAGAMSSLPGRAGVVSGAGGWGGAEGFARAASELLTSSVGPLEEIAKANRPLAAQQAKILLDDLDRLSGGTGHFEPANTALQMFINNITTLGSGMGGIGTFFNRQNREITAQRLNEAVQRLRAIAGV